MNEHENEFDINNTENGEHPAEEQSPETMPVGEATEPTESTREETPAVDTEEPTVKNEEPTPEPEVLAPEAAEPTAEPEPPMETPEAALAVAPPQELSQMPAPEGPAPKKSGKKVAAIVAGAVALVAVIGIAVGVSVNNTPEKIVLRALAKTMGESETASKEMYDALPILNSVDATQPTGYEFDVSVEGIDAADEGIVSIGSMLRGIGIRGTASGVPEKRIAEIDGGLYIGTTDLLGMYMYVSPEAAAFSIPMFTDTVLAVHPNTMVEELANSPFRDIANEKNALEIQKNLMQLFSQEANQNTVDVNATVRRDITALFAKDVPGIQFEKGPVQDGRKTYVVTAPGAEIKAFFVDVVRYMLLDSPLELVYRQGFAPMLEQTGMTYESYIENGITALQENLSGLALNMVVTVEKGRASKVDITLTPDGTGSQALDIAGLNAVLELPQGLDMSFDGTMDAVLYGEPVSMTIDGNRVWDGGKGYQMAADAAVTLGTSNVTTEFSQNYETGGTVRQNVDIDVDMGYTTLLLGLDLEGSVTRGSGDVLRQYDYPTLNITLGMFDEEYTLKLKANAQERSIPAELTPSRPYTFLTDISDAQAQQVLQEYTDGMDRLNSLLNGLLAY